MLVRLHLNIAQASLGRDRPYERSSEVDPGLTQNRPLSESDPTSPLTMPTPRRGGLAADLPGTDQSRIVFISTGVSNSYQ